MDRQRILFSSFFSSSWCILVSASMGDFSIHGSNGTRTRTTKTTDATRAPSNPRTSFPPLHITLSASPLPASAAHRLCALPFPCSLHLNVQAFVVHSKHTSHLLHCPFSPCVSPSPQFHEKEKKTGCSIHVTLYPAIDAACPVHTLMCESLDRNEAWRAYASISRSAYGFFGESRQSVGENYRQRKKTDERV